MTLLKLPKKLLPAKRALTRITNILKSKLQKLKLSKALKSTTRRLTTFRPLLASICFKRRGLTKPSFGFLRPDNHQYYHRSHHHHNHMQKGYAAIYIDHLYADNNINVMHAKGLHANSSAQAGTSSGVKQVNEEKKEGEEHDNPNSIEDAWKAIVAKSPQLRCVDERAEEFITNFKEEKRLQKERSLLEFQERLARSA